MRAYAILAGLLLTGAAQSADTGTSGAPVPILGVSIGGQVGSIRTCPPDTSKSRVLCWVDTPYKHRDGGRSGMIHLPNPDGRPKWAAYAIFEAEVSRKGDLERLNVRTHDAESLADIQGAITGRFGQPTTPPLRTARFYSAVWILKEISIRMRCVLGEYCTVDVASPAWWADYQAELEDRKKKDAARPPTL